MEKAHNAMFYSRARWGADMASERSRNSTDTRMLKPRWSIPTFSTVDRRAFVVRWTGCEVIQGGCYADPHKMPG